ncbi:MAG TPA: class I SAM-dependent methyltransferase [Desulfobacteraceae bacterium]|nr:class I SAM-dependent methyltransferase [Desulfobacteraceae bacterium]
MVPVPSYPETEDIVTASEDYAGRFAGEVGGYFLELQRDLTLELLKPYPGATILDVGGGHAQLAVPLVEQGFRVTVTGSSDECRRRLDSRLAAGSFSYRTCDMLHLPYDDRSFDVVIAFRLIPHVVRWRELIAEMSRVARLAVIVDYPDKRSFNFLTSQLFGLKKKLEVNTRPYTLFTRKQIIEAFGRHSMGSPVARHEFFLPMVLHRKMSSVSISRRLENAARACGLVRLFGSPVIIRFQRLSESK